MDILLPWFLKRAVQKMTQGLWAPHPLCVYLADFCAANNFTGFCFPLLPICLSTYGASLLTYPHALLRMGQVFLQSSVWLLHLLCLLRRTAYTYHNTTIAPESIGVVTVVTLLYDSPVRHIDLSIGVSPLWIPKTLTSPIARRYVWFCFLFILTHHINQIIQVTGKDDQGHEADLLRWSLP